MRAVVVSAFGAPPQLVPGEVPDPTVGPGQALVAVSYAGVNFADVVMRRGEAMTPAPFVPGVEGSGRIVALAPDVHEPGLDVGTRVAWAPTARASSIGSYAELLAVGVGQLLPLPDEVSLLDAAAMTLQGLTAHYLANEKVRIVPGTTVLVHAAAGGTGRLVVQWTKHLGATVIATVSSDHKADVARRAGADHVVRYDEVDFADEVLRLTGGRGVDYIADGIAAGTIRPGLRALARRGHLCLYGRAAGVPDPISPLELLPKSLTLSGGLMSNFLLDRDEVLAKAGDVWRGMRDGWLTPEIHQVHDLVDAAAAHDALEHRRTTGKLVLRVAGD